jgi:hypothetical protein
LLLALGFGGFSATTLFVIHAIQRRLTTKTVLRGSTDDGAE